MEYQSIKEEYFKEQEKCSSLACQKVIFEPDTKREWFFEDDFWCYFEFYCEDNDYALKKIDEKVFSRNCVIKDMSYEIKMLLGYTRLRKVVTIEKELFNQYVFRFEKEKQKSPNITIERFNFQIKENEEEALDRSDKIANVILGGCLTMIGVILALFLISLVFYLKKNFMW